MKKCALLVLVLVCIFVALFGVPPMLTAQDTAQVLFGFLVLVICAGTSAASLSYIMFK